MRFLLILAISLSLLACSKGESPEARDEPAPAATEVILEGGVEAMDSPVPKSELQGEMQGHFAAIRGIERALVVGDMDRAKELADELVQLNSNEEIVGAEEEMQSVRVAARVFLESDSLASAAQAAAALASTCGTCHVQNTSISAFEWKPAPLADGRPQERMQRHQWAMDRLWEGLVGPSEFSWQQGTEILVAAPFPVDLLLADKEDKEKVAAGSAMLRQLEALGKKAADAQELADRAQVYGELLTLCSSCHQLTRK